MISYKDMAFCWESVFGTGCCNKECYRNLTDKENEKAIKWWNNGNDIDDEIDTNYPIAVGKNFKNDICGYINKDIKK